MRACIPQRSIHPKRFRSLSKLAKHTLQIHCVRVREPDQQDPWSGCLCSVPFAQQHHNQYHRCRWSAACCWQWIHRVYVKDRNCMYDLLIESCMSLTSFIVPFSAWLGATMNTSIIPQSLLTLCQGHNGICSLKQQRQGVKALLHLQALWSSSCSMIPCMQWLQLLMLYEHISQSAATICSKCHPLVLALMRTCERCIWFQSTSVTRFLCSQMKQSLMSWHHNSPSTDDVFWAYLVLLALVLCTSEPCTWAGHIWCGSSAHPSQGLYHSMMQWLMIWDV